MPQILIVDEKAQRNGLTTDKYTTTTEISKGTSVNEIFQTYDNHYYTQYITELELIK